jgi:hypothetical protein
VGHHRCLSLTWVISFSLTHISQNSFSSEAFGYNMPWNMIVDTPCCMKISVVPRIFLGNLWAAAWWVNATSTQLDLSVLLCVKALHLVTMFCVLMHRFYCVRVVQVGRQLKQIPKLLSNFVAGEGHCHFRVYFWTNLC